MYLSLSYGLIAFKYSVITNNILCEEKITVVANEHLHLLIQFYNVLFLYFFLLHKILIDKNLVLELCEKKDS